MPLAPETDCRSPPTPCLVYCLQEERLVFEQHQQEVMQQQEVARHTAWRVTQLAKCDLQVLKHKQEQQRQQAALVHQRMTCWNK